MLYLFIPLWIVCVLVLLAWYLYVIFVLIRDSRARFSLRTLLLIITMMAILFGIAAAGMHQH